MTPPVLVGLDIATRTGWARWDGSAYATGVLDCSPTSRDEPEGERFARLADALPLVLRGASAVLFERTHSRGGRAAEVLNGLTGVALVVCERLGLEYGFIEASVLKAHGVASWGAHGKEAMRLHVCGLLGREVTSDEADAFALIDLYRARVRGPFAECETTRRTP